MAEVIVVTSGKGGVGKTTITANIGVGLAQLGKRTAVIDTDIGLRNLDVVLGMENKIVFDLYDVAARDCPISQALIKDKRFDDLYFLSAPQTKDKDAIRPEDMIKICGELREKFDYILIDCPAGMEHGFKNAIAAANRAFVVAAPEIASIRDADRILGLLEESGIKDFYLIINRLRPHLAGVNGVLSINDIVDLLAVDLIGAIPEDEAVFISANIGEPVIFDMKSAAGQALRNITRRLLGEEVMLMKLDKSKRILKKYKKMYSGLNPNN